MTFSPPSAPQKAPPSVAARLDVAHSYEPTRNHSIPPSMCMEEMVSAIRQMPLGSKIRTNGPGPSKVEKVFLAAVMTQISRDGYFTIKDVQGMLPHLSDKMYDHVRDLQRRKCVTKQPSSDGLSRRYQIVGAPTHDEDELRHLLAKTFPTLPDTQYGVPAAAQPDQHVPLRYNIFDRHNEPLLYKEKSPGQIYQVIEPADYWFVPLSMLDSHAKKQSHFQITSDNAQLRIYSPEKMDVGMYACHVKTVKYEGTHCRMHVLQMPGAFTALNPVVILEQTIPGEPAPDAPGADTFQMYRQQADLLLKTRRNADTSLSQLDNSVCEMLRQNEMVQDNAANREAIQNVWSALSPLLAKKPL